MSPEARKSPLVSDGVTTPAQTQQAILLALCRLNLLSLNDMLDIVSEAERPASGRVS